MAYASTGVTKNTNAVFFFIYREVSEVSLREDIESGRFTHQQLLDAALSGKYRLVEAEDIIRQSDSQESVKESKSV